MVTQLRKIRDYNQAAIRNMPTWARFVAVIPPQRHCDVCATASGLFALQELPPLPHKKCACSDGCACFYAVRFEPTTAHARPGSA